MADDSPQDTPELSAATQKVQSSNALDMSTKQKIDQARQALEQATQQLQQATAAYTREHSDANQQRLDDAKTAVKDAGKQLADAISQDVTAKISSGRVSEISSYTGASSRRSTHSGGDSSDAVPIVAIVFVFLYLIVRAIMSPFCRKNRRGAQAVISGGFTPEEVALMHKMQRTLGQMESRVEALETILIERRSSGASGIVASRRSARAQNPDPAATHDL